MSKQFYFFVYYPRTQKETENDIDFVVPKEVEQRPECIYSVETYSNGIHYYKKIHYYKYLVISFKNWSYC